MRYKIKLMTKIRLFCDESLEEKKEIHIDGDNFHYLSNVMRCNIGTTIFLFNEKDGEFESKILKKMKKNIILIIYKRIQYQKLKNTFHLAFCAPKSNKLDTLIQKCTEIGVNSFIPVISDHTENRKLNINRLKKIIKEAVEQSNQIHIPDIYKPISFKNFVNNIEEEDCMVFFADIQSNISFPKLKIDNTNSNIIFIGPEGDFSVNELNILRKKNKFVSFTLGKRILRSETAAISSLVLFNSTQD